ncbi:MAG: helix-turn-helix transcriptional regulator [Actinobacteria bacterium]|nr:MAG: helix-turn-helix transcriptional regulator [Actinomycetota bacterium]TMM22156.1 MAG: helix-turn-helix transcriptional regulator [Actinomycetota bacterium]
MAITYVGADLVQELQQALPAALAGDEDAARRYARAWHQLVLQLVGSASRAPASAVEVLDRLSLTAPFDPLGPIHALMSVASTIIGDMDQRPAVRSSPVILPASIDFDGFTRAVLDELAGAGSAIRSLLSAWQLSIAEAARLFGVTRQAMQQWLAGDVPPARLPKVLAVVRIADLLSRNIRPERIGGIVRSPVPGYAGATMLQLIAQDRHQELLDSVARSFDWAATA